MAVHSHDSPLGTWISEIHRNTGWNPTTLARHAGVSPSTILRPLNNPKHKFKLSLKTLQKVASVSNTDIPRELLTGFEDVSITANKDMERRPRSEPTPPLDEPSSGGSHVTCRMSVQGSGRIEIPAAVASAIGGRPGEVLVARIDDGILTLQTVDNALRRARALVRRYVPEGVSLVDELIAERRAEAARE